MSAEQYLLALRNLDLILRSKSTSLPNISCGDLVEIFVKRSGQRRGKWFLARSLLDIYRNMGTVTVSFSQEKKIAIALKDVRPSFESDIFAATVREANDMIDETITESIDDL